MNQKQHEAEGTGSCISHDFGADRPPWLASSIKTSGYMQVDI